MEFNAPDTIAATLAAGRAAIGTALLVAPRTTTRPVLGKDALSRGTVVMARATGARDLALAAGTLAAMLRGDDARAWVLTSILADGTDVLATLAARPAGSRAGIVGLLSLAGPAVVLSALVAPRLSVRR